MIGVAVASNKEWDYVKIIKDSIKEVLDYIYGEYFQDKMVEEIIRGLKRLNPLKK